MFENLEKATVGDGVEVILRGIFYKSKLREIVVPASVKVIEEDAFGKCKYLNKITFAEQL